MAKPQLKFFYKKKKRPKGRGIKPKARYARNKELMVQLNLTSKCPLNCPFCYIKEEVGHTELSLEKLKKLWLNLRKYSKELGVVYRINLTGGDIFYHTDIKNIIDFVKSK